MANNMALRGEGILTYQTVHGRSLEGNLLGDSPNRDVLVYLPPAYLASPTRRFPVVYLLHGFNGTSTIWRDGFYQGFSVKPSLDRLIGEGTVRDMILVMPDGRNCFGGTYFINSTVTGNWADFITRELIEYIDATYRTLPSRESRGIAGQSMGGYSALYLAMMHPDLFSSVYALSACCLDFVGDISQENPEWPEILRMKTREDLLHSHLTTPSQGNYAHALTALAAAISPNPEKPPLYVDWPFQLVEGGVRKVESVYQKWLSHFPTHMVDACQANLESLQGIGFTAGISDHLSHIPLGSRSFSHALSRAGIPHTFELETSDHRQSVREWMETRVFPFLSLLLKFETPTWYKRGGF